MCIWQENEGSGDSEVEVWESDDEPSIIEHRSQGTVATSFIHMISLTLLIWQALFNILV